MDETRPSNRAGSGSRSNIDFLRGFLKSPKDVGSVIPSSRYMERSIIDYARPDHRRVVVELGPGTGGTTRALLTAMAADARLLAIDLDSQFTEIVSGIGDPRLISHTGSATDLGEILRRHGLAAADVVVSGIPFSTMPKPIGESIVRAVYEALAPAGAFVAYQFRPEVARLAEPVFGSASRTEMVMRNIPPMRIWRWEKADK